MNYISVKRLLNAELDKIISYVSYPSPNTIKSKMTERHSVELIRYQT